MVVFHEETTPATTNTTTRSTTTGTTTTTETAATTATKGPMPTSSSRSDATDPAWDSKNMVPTMTSSGRFRQAIGPARARLRNILTEASGRGYDFATIQDPEELRIALTKAEATIKLDLARINDTRELIHRYNDKWLYMIPMLDEAKREEEDVIYEKFCTGTEGINAILNEAGDVHCILSVRLDEIKDMLANLRQRQMARTSSFVSEPPRNHHVSVKGLTWDGNPGMYHTWRDVYNAGVHHQSIPNIQKFLMLRESWVVGKAFETIDGLRVVEENYGLAIERLEKLAEPADVRSSLFHNLYSISPASERATEVRTVFDKAEKILIQLEERGEDVNHPNIDFEYMKKFPQWVLQRIMEAKLDDPNWNLKKTRERIDRILKIREEVDKVQRYGNSKQAQKQARPETQYQKLQSSAYPIVSTEASGKKSSKKQRSRRGPCCAYCNGDHKSENCTTFVDEARANKAKEDGKCFRCLGKMPSRHSIRKCDSKGVCSKCNDARHHTSLHEHFARLYPTSQSQHEATLKPHNQKARGNRQTVAAAIPVGEAENEVASQVVASVLSNPIEERKVLMTLMYSKHVVLRVNGKKSVVFSFFDTGSVNSFITRKKALELNARKVGETWVSLETFGGTNIEYVADICEVEIQLVDGSFLKVRLLSSPALVAKIMSVRCPYDKELLKLTDEELNKAIGLHMPDILIGMDHWHDFKIAETGEYLHGYRVNSSHVGQMLSGPKLTYAAHAVVAQLEENTESEKTLNELLEKMYKLESLGITDPHDVDENVKVMEHFKKTVKQLKDGRYEVSLPWRAENPSVPDNFKVCVARLKSLLNKLKSHPNPDAIVKFAENIDNELKNGITEEVQLDSPSGPIVSYLPQDVVITPEKATTKFRNVSDASQKGGPLRKSVNDHLFRGPVLLRNMVGILLRFRIFMICIIADIQKAFHQVSLNPSDRDATRFLWVKDIDKPVTIDNLIILRFMRLIFGIICAPFLMAAVICHHLEKLRTPLSSEVLQNIYADNILVSATSKEEAVQKARECKAMFMSAKMNLREFISNDTETNLAFPRDDAAKEVVVKYLGLKWDTRSDTFVLEVPSKIQLDNGRVTKRILAKSVASLFDPLGLISPVMLEAKLLLQRVWSQEYKWDQELREEDVNKWRKIRNNWTSEAITLPRRVVVTSEIDEYEIHAFTDASGSAFATTIYLRQKTRAGYVTSLIFAKSRLLPIKRPTIPRAELLGVLAGARASKFVKEELGLNIKKTYLWSDSKCVIAWVLNPSILQSVFVENRLREIRASGIDEFRYVPTGENPSDIGTRGMTIEELRLCDLWWFGPKWLRLDSQYWPAMPDQEQLKPDLYVDTDDPQQVVATVIPLEPQTSVITFENFGSWEKLVRTMAYVLRILKKKEKTIELQTNELTVAEKAVLREAQKKHPPKPKEIYAFDLRKDDEGLWRAYGRLSLSGLKGDALTPIFLSKHSHVAILLITHVHKRLMHAGSQHTLAEVRRKFWIPSGMATVKKAIYGTKNQRIYLGRCLGCAGAKAKPFELPRMANLPKERVTRSIPFTFCGLDNFGPMYFKDNLEKKKAWGLIITCMATRAVHVECVRDMTPKSFLLAFRKFMARRTIPQRILSDNSSTFKPSSKAIESLWNTIIKSPETVEFLAKNRIEWCFIPEKAPFFGGFYERLIALIKNALRRTYGKRCLEKEEMDTTLVEIECIVNSRPLCYVPDELTARILRPIDLINPGAQQGLPFLENEAQDSAFIPKLNTVEKLVDEYKKTSKVVDEFWKIWEKDYLSALRERTKFRHDQPHHLARIAPKLNEVVLIEEEEQPRMQWSMGRIVELVKSTDGEVRVAKVKIANGHVLTRPLNLLYPLEVTDENLANAPVELKADPEKRQPEVRKWQLRQRKKVREVSAPVIHSPKTWFYTFALILICLPGFFAIQCPKGEINQIVHRPHCTDHGIIVKQRSDQTLCWDYVRCDTGYMMKKSSQEFFNDLELCQERCPCEEKWADECSFYNGSSIKISTFNDPRVKETLRSLSPEVCSFTPSPTCDQEPRKAKFGKVMLFDGTMHLVKSMNMATKDAFKGEHICIGNREGPVTGTPQYCQDYDCEVTGTILCFHDQPHITTLEAEEMSIPLKAWGYADVQYFGSIRPRREATCEKCTAKCVKEGVYVSLEENVNLMAVCNDVGDCSYHKNPGLNKTVYLAPEDMLSDHVIKIQIWSMGKLIRELDIFCNANDQCTDLCIFCLARIETPHCVPILSVLVAMTYLWMVGVAVSVVVYIGKWGVSGLYQLLRCCCCGAFYLREIWSHWRKYQRIPTVVEEIGELDKVQRSEEIPLIQPETSTSRDKSLVQWEIEAARKEEEVDDDESTTSTIKTPFIFEPLGRSPLLTLLGILYLIGGVRCCSVTSVINATQEVCQASGNDSIQCHINYQEVMKLLPQGQQICFQVKDHLGRPVATVKLEALDARLKCKPKTEAFLRSAYFHTRSIRRCPGTGSCIGPKCSNITQDAKIPELGSGPNEAPGITFCEDGCSCWGCLCFYCDASCVFWRIYAVPASENFFELFSCLYFEPVLNLQVTVEGATTKKHSFTLAPGTTDSWENVKITLQELNTPPAPVLNNKFVTDGERTSIVTSTSEHHLNKFICNSADQMAKFSCHLEPEVCRCQTTQDTKHCTCTNQIVEDYFMDLDLLLPTLQNDSDIIHAKGRDVWASPPWQTAEILLQLDSLPLILKVDNSICKWISYNLTGCHNCRRGATLGYSCVSDIGEAHGQVECSSGLRFSVICDQEGAQRQVQLFMDSSRISEECHLRCPSSTEDIQIQGNLRSGRTFLPDQYHERSSGTYLSKTPDYRNLGLNLLGWLWTDVYIFIAAASYAIIFVMTVIVCRIRICGRR